MIPRTHNAYSGFTLIEILVVIGMIAILGAVVLIAVNPLRQFAQARNSQRISNVNTIINAIGNRIAENHGLFSDPTTCPISLPTTPTVIGSGSGKINLRSCLVPGYISEIPVDPSIGSNTCSTDVCAGTEGYDTGYTIATASSTGRITICAPAAAESAISGSAPYCISR